MGGNSTSGGASLSLPAKISVQSVPMILDPTHLPPDPGAERDKTVAGVDSNGNGIRDDVERWIAQEYPSSARMRAATSQRALTLQKKMTETNLTAARAYEIGLASMASSSCSVETIYELKVYGSSTTNLKKLMSAQINTKDRLKAYISYQKILGSRAFEILENGCDIGPKQLPN